MGFGSGHGNFTLRIFFVCLSFGLISCASTPEKKVYSKTEKARMLVDMANAALSEGDTVGALENLLRAEQEDPRLPEVYHSKALAYFGKNDLATAILQARRAIELFPDYAEANNTYGKLLIDAGRYEEAEAPLQVAAKNPLYRDAYKASTNLGILFYHRGNYPEALKHLERAIQASPQLACVAYYYRGHIRVSEARLSEAISSYEQATRKYCAMFADAHLALGIAFEKSRQYEKARAKFIDLQQRYPNTKVADQAVNHLRYLP